MDTFLNVPIMVVVFGTVAGLSFLTEQECFWRRIQIANGYALPVGFTFSLIDILMLGEAESLKMSVLVPFFLVVLLPIAYALALSIFTSVLVLRSSPKNRNTSLGNFVRESSVALSAKPLLLFLVFFIYQKTVKFKSY